MKYIENATKNNDMYDTIRENGAIATLGLTYTCQCNCIHCGMAMYEKNALAELKTVDWLRIINELPTDIIKNIIFFGGEPTLRTDLVELIIAAKKRGFKAVVDTNGYLLTSNFVKKMKIVGLDFFEISIDSPNQKIHDRRRNMKGLFDKLQEGIKNCKTNGVIFGLSTYATKKNIENGDLKKIIDWGRELGAAFVRVLSPLLIGKWINEDNLKLNDQEKKALNNILDGKFAFSEEKLCPGIKKIGIYISPYGEVQPCPYLPLAFGNAHKEPIKNIIHKMWKHPIYKIKTGECLVNNEKIRNDYIKNLKTVKKLPIDLSQ